ncbi:replication-relaxation family protein [Patescibacteria group bacterium]|nr:replication-relaxation family protein [Patescibacteria group bacterium]
MNYKTLPNITDRQKEIIDLAFRFRFINRIQIQRLLNHKDPKRINAWLKDLVNKKYLGRIYSHKLLENTKPAIYYLDNNGIIFSKDKKTEEYQAYEEMESKYFKKFYDDKHATLKFFNHCVNISEIYTQFKEYERKVNKKKKRDLEYFCRTKTELSLDKKLWTRDNEEYNEIRKYFPDLYIEKFNDPDGEIKSSTFFLELFDPHVPRYAIKYRVKQYIKLKEEGDWKYVYTGTDNKFPIIILIFPNQGKQNFLSGYIKEQLERSFESEGLIFLLTTYQKILTNTITTKEHIWKEIKYNQG